MPITDPVLMTAVNIIRRIVVDQQGHAGRAVSEHAVRFLMNHGWLSDARLTERPRFIANESEAADVL